MLINNHMKFINFLFYFTFQIFSVFYKLANISKTGFKNSKSNFEMSPKKNLEFVKKAISILNTMILHFCMY